jgi:predicted metalloprotease with PDZ domain
LTTLSASVPAPIGGTSAEANDYLALADSQVLMGPNLHLTLIKRKISLFFAAYSEGDADLRAEGQLAGEALDAVEGYFGNAPFPAYTVQLELLRPIPNHTYGFSQEHINSGTFSFTVAQAITNRSSIESKRATLFNYAHHIAHCWIPKRAYGTSYSPFTWEMPPVIETIWFNEGFARFAAIEALAEAMPADQGAAFRERQLARLRQILDDAPAFVQEMPLLELSREASFMYSLDFRIGSNTYARGALMAEEMDSRIRQRTSGKQTLRDALRFLLNWTQQNQRAFATEELRSLLSQSTGIDVQDILARWMKANPAPLPPHPTTPQ